MKDVFYINTSKYHVTQIIQYKENISEINWKGIPRTSHLGYNSSESLFLISYSCMCFTIQDFFLGCQEN